MGALYQLNFPNGKSYIGICLRSVDKRFDEHAGKKRPRTPVQCAINSFGRDNVEVKTLVVADDWDYLCDLERKAIAAYGTRFPLGYNMTDGGDGVHGLKRSDASKGKDRERAKKQHQDPAYIAAKREGLAKVLSTAEYRRNQSEAKKRNWADPEYRARMLEARRRKRSAS